MIGVDRKMLAETVGRFNTHAADGHDPDYGRGDYAFDQHFGDPTADHPTLAPLRDPPFTRSRFSLVASARRADQKPTTVETSFSPSPASRLGDSSPLATWPQPVRLGVPRSRRHHRPGPRLRVPGRRGCRSRIGPRWWRSEPHGSTDWMRSRGPIQSMRSYGTLLSKNVATDPAPPYPCRDAPHLQVFPCNTSLNIVGTPSVWLYLAFFLIGVGNHPASCCRRLQGCERSLVASGSAVWRRGSGGGPAWIGIKPNLSFAPGRYVVHCLRDTRGECDDKQDRQDKKHRQNSSEVGISGGVSVFGFHAIDDGRWVFGLE